MVTVYAFPLPEASQDAPGIVVKLAGVVQLTRHILALHDAAFLRPGAVLDHTPAALLRARTRAERLAVMADPTAPSGDPARTLERWATVEHIGEGGAGVPATDAESLADAAGADAGIDVADRVRVTVHWGFPADADGALEAAAFRTALRSTDPAQPGLAAYLRHAGGWIIEGLDSYGYEYPAGRWEFVSRVESAAYDVVADDLGADQRSGLPDVRHRATLDITVTAAPA